MKIVKNKIQWVLKGLIIKNGIIRTDVPYALRPTWSIACYACPTHKSHFSGAKRIQQRKCFFKKFISLLYIPPSSSSALFGGEAFIFVPFVKNLL